MSTELHHPLPQRSIAKGFSSTISRLLREPSSPTLARKRRQGGKVEASVVEPQEVKVEPVQQQQEPAAEFKQERISENSAQYSELDQQPAAGVLPEQEQHFEEYTSPQIQASAPTFNSMSNASASGALAPGRHDLDFGNDEDVEISSQYASQELARNPSGDEGQSYDLKPPPPTVPLSNIELLSGRLFSADHLKVILRDSTLHARFKSFIATYRPQCIPALQRYRDVQKALTAIEYANAVADQIAPGSVAALLQEDFETRAQTAVDVLVTEAMPGYVTHRFTQIVTETLVKEITGQNTPMMRDLVPSLAEVYCLTDPSLPDNPIVYASEEFYRTTQYGANYTIGRNCRFLQGPRTSHATVGRLIDALAEGAEICETILNYRRDGTPFLNLLLIAPLYDNKGVVRYFIGAQVDINGLLEQGRGLDSFSRLLVEDRLTTRYGGRPPPKPPQTALAEMCAVLSEAESVIVKGTVGRDHFSPGSGASTPSVGGPGMHRARRAYIGMDDPSDRDLWPAAHLGPSGRLPGVFQNYLLIRPYPSLRITFTSPTLRIPGLLQSRFLDRIGGPPQIREGILNAMSSGVGVTAKITWLTQPQPQPMQSSGSNADGRRSYDSGSGGSVRSVQQASSRPGTSGSQTAFATIDETLVSSPHAQQGLQDDGKPRWIHCTPLLGSDGRVGVWMVVLVENEHITGGLNANSQTQAAAQAREYRAPSVQQQSPVYRSGSNASSQRYPQSQGQQSQQQQQQQTPQRLGGPTSAGYSQRYPEMPPAAQPQSQPVNHTDAHAQPQAHPQQPQPQIQTTNNNNHTDQLHQRLSEHITYHSSSPPTQPTRRFINDGTDDNPDRGRSQAANANANVSTSNAAAQVNVGNRYNQTRHVSTNNAGLAPTGINTQPSTKGEFPAKASLPNHNHIINNNNASGQANTPVVPGAYPGTIGIDTGSSVRANGISSSNINPTISSLSPNPNPNPIKPNNLGIPPPPIPTSIPTTTATGLGSAPSVVSPSHSISNNNNNNSNNSNSVGVGVRSPRYSANPGSVGAGRLYAEYLRREGRSGSSSAGGAAAGE